MALVEEALGAGVLALIPNLLPIALVLGAMGWTGIPIASCYAACATGAQAIEIARTRILAGMAQVAGEPRSDAGSVTPQRSSLRYSVLRSIPRA